MDLPLSAPSPAAETCSQHSGAVNTGSYHFSVQVGLVVLRAARMQNFLPTTDVSEFPARVAFSRRSSTDQGFGCSQQRGVSASSSTGSEADETRTLRVRGGGAVELVLKLPESAWRPLQLCWLPDDGGPAQPYGALLRPGQQMRQQTHEGHRWAMYDETRRHLVLTLPTITSSAQQAFDINDPNPSVPAASSSAPDGSTLFPAWLGHRSFGCAADVQDAIQRCPPLSSALVQPATGERMPMHALVERAASVAAARDVPVQHAAPLVHAPVPVPQLVPLVMRDVQRRVDGGEHTYSRRITKGTIYARANGAGFGLYESWDDAQACGGAGHAGKFEYSENNPNPGTKFGSFGLVRGRARQPARGVLRPRARGCARGDQRRTPCC